MKKLLIALMIFIALSVMAYYPARADNGPHGGFNSPTTDTCAGCHRAHTGQEQSLLLVGTATLCESCHGPTGTGADTDAWDGVYLERDSNNENPQEGVVNRGLRGGGFLNAVMDTSLSGSASSAASTSWHTFDNSPGMMWGNGSIGSGPGTSVPLDCGSCHNPHGNAGTGGTPTYRILRPVPNGSGTGSGVEIADPANKFYSVDDPNGNYWGQNYGTVEVPLAEWCSLCHTRYLATSGSEENPSGDPIFAFRHRADGSDGVTCMDCHVAHGTSASMGLNSGSVPWPDDSTTPSGNARSSLLRIDNRGVCVQCHLNP
jgi:predicted CXXCH cytochrome family protein